MALTFAINDEQKQVQQKRKKNSLHTLSLLGKGLDNKQKHFVTPKTSTVHRQYCSM